MKYGNKCRIADGHEARLIWENRLFSCKKSRRVVFPFVTGQWDFVFV